MGRGLSVFQAGIEVRVSVPAAGWDEFELGGQMPTEHPFERAFVVREPTVMAVDLCKVIGKLVLASVAAKG